LLRLVRDGLPDAVYRQENRALREVARTFSPVRDGAVLVMVHDEVAVAGAKPPSSFRAGLVERHEHLRRELLDQDAPAAARERLATVTARIDTWPATAVEWRVLGAGLERVYRRGRKAMAAAYDDPRPERFHQWRKRTKYLRHQLQLLKELWPEVVGGTADAAHELTDVLGDEHDLVVLRGAYLAAGYGDDRSHDAVVEFLTARSEALRAQARLLGQRIYAEKPARFVRRLGQYWEAAARPAAAA
jgi:CHAD domain-containing protein